MQIRIQKSYMKLWYMDPPNAEWFGTSKVSVLNKFDLDFYIAPTLRMKITVLNLRWISAKSWTSINLPLTDYIISKSFPLWQKLQLYWLRLYVGINFQYITQSVIFKDCTKGKKVIGLWPGNNLVRLCKCPFKGSVSW